MEHTRRSARSSRQRYTGAAGVPSAALLPVTQAAAEIEPPDGEEEEVQADASREDGRHDGDRSSRSSSDSSSVQSETEHSNSEMSESGEDEQVRGCAADEGRRIPRTADPGNASFPRSRYIGDAIVGRGTGAAAASAPSAKAGRIGRPMHEGDDEGRPSAKRVRRPPPQQQQPELGEEDENGGDDAAMEDDGDEYNDDEEEDDDDGSDEEGLDDQEDAAGSEDDDDGDDDGGERSPGNGMSHRTVPNSRRPQQQNARAHPGAGSQASRHSARIVTNAMQQQQLLIQASPSGVQHPSSSAHAPASRRPSPSHSSSRRPAPRVRMSKCWLCTFANSKMARQVSSFVSANAGCMDPTIMADQIKQEVVKEVGPFYQFTHPKKKTHCGSHTIRSRGCVRVCVHVLLVLLVSQKKFKPP